MLPHLPQELIDSIVDNLHDDKRALASASMISTTWLPSCQSHLFHSIYMKRMLNQGYNDFVDFLESTPVVSGYIKYLHLKGEFRTPVLVRLLGCLNRLTSLKIQGIFLSVKPVVLPFPPVKLDFLLVELIYNINYPSYPVAEIVKKGAEEDIWEQDEENHRDSSGEEDWDSRVNDPSEEESEVEDDEGTDEGMDGGEGEEDNNQANGSWDRDILGPDCDEAKRLVSVLRLFGQVRELIVAYHSESRPWWLESEQLLTLIPIGEALEVDTFRLYHENPNGSTIALFQRFLRMSSLRTFMLKSQFYLHVNEFLDFLLGAPSLVDLTVPAEGVGEYSITLDTS